MFLCLDYLDDSPSFFFDVEVDYIIVVRHYAMSQQLFSSNHRQLGIALPVILAAGMLRFSKRATETLCFVSERSDV
jgi:hypothetical protein